MKLPQLSSDLIKELDKLYPDSCPSLADSDREVWYKAGQRSVVNRLLIMLSSQESDTNVLIKPQDPRSR